MYQDLMVWNIFLAKFNGISYMLDDNWSSSSVLQLYCDSAAGATLECGCYLQGKWANLQWPTDWHNTEVLGYITYLEMIPIALSVYLWGNLFSKKKFWINSDNKAVVEILNKASSKSLRVMSLVRYIVHWSLLGNFHIKGNYIPGYSNVYADLISRGKFQKFKSLAKSADAYPAVIPVEFLRILDRKYQNC